jgi:hypothetical protein
MIDLKYIVKTSLMLLLKRIIGIFLIILLLAELVLLVLKINEFLILLDRFSIVKYDISIFWIVGIFKLHFIFFDLVRKLLEFFSIRIWIRK